MGAAVSLTPDNKPRAKSEIVSSDLTFPRTAHGNAGSQSSRRITRRSWTTAYKPCVIDALFDKSVWLTTPVSERPEIELLRCQVFELPGGDRHLVGRNGTERQGRTSSKIVTFDAATDRSRTASGRIYQVSGRTGFDDDGAYTRRHWPRLHRLVAFTDVCEQVEAAIHAALQASSRGQAE